MVRTHDSSRSELPRDPSSTCAGDSYRSGSALEEMLTLLIESVRSSEIDSRSVQEARDVAAGHLLRSLCSSVPMAGIQPLSQNGAARRQPGCSSYSQKPPVSSAIDERKSP